MSDNFKELQEDIKYIEEQLAEEDKKNKESGE